MFAPYADDARKRYSVATIFAFSLAFVFSSCRTLETDKVATGAIDQPTFALIDLDGDGQVSPKEMATHKHREGLAEFDLDNDGRISAAEWKAARPSSTGEAFVRLDRNGDGFLDEDEAVSFVAANPEFQMAFAKMDANGDGFLHWEEYASGEGASLDVTLFSVDGATDTAPGTN